ncbi:MAG: UDP-3-O-(3-hydroxymyristoyl)glucosamine N-acyltransferase [Dysgonamonadaceae bacterium]|jgi:UDP-3-O-[3-hydroxymyristoyl] glucosamine N-acyltransferase|nr:UDP-3-O-(3-hydroxymyristoyl)glucosamine N-acyltransferase [Dysgonamonadaceae bacterium]
MKFSAKEIAGFLKGEIIGDPNVEVSDFAKIEEGKPATITFLANPKYTHFIYETKSDIVLVNNDFEPEQAIRATLIKVPNAYTALASLLEMATNAAPKKSGVEEMSFIAPSATTGQDIYVGAFAYIGEKAEIGDGSKVYPQAYVGDNVKIGKNTTIYSGVKIYQGCVVGDNCILHSGAVIGADGFGFSNEDGVYHKIPQMGNVIIEDDVEIGANTTIDRAVMGSTIIRRGVKLDNLIQIAHNCEVGKHTAMAAQVGVAGSSKIGENCVLGGQAGIGGHISIGNNVRVGAQAGIISNTKDGAEIIGTPAFPVKNYFRSSIIIQKLPDMYKQLSNLEREVERLKKQLNEK